MTADDPQQAETPETDAAAFSQTGEPRYSTTTGAPTKVVTADFARSLERRLLEKKKIIATLHNIRREYEARLQAQRPATAAVPPAEAAQGEREAVCPKCGSRNPMMHPAVQSEGEVHLCRHPWHSPTAAEIEASWKSSPAPQPAISPAPQRDVVSVLRLRICYVHPTQEQRDVAWKSKLANTGDVRLIWINEGDLHRWDCGVLVDEFKP